MTKKSSPPPEKTAKKEASGRISPSLPCRAQPGDFLSFLVGGHEYAVPILECREIVAPGECTPVPNTPPWMLGLMNLRGTVLPVVDLPKKIGVAETERTGRGAIIAVNVRDESEETTIGILVESVEQVVSLVQEELEDVPSFGAPIRADCLLGLAHAGDRVILLLDVHRTLSADELLALRELRTDEEESEDEAS